MNLTALTPEDRTAIEGDLIALDREYLTLYGPHETTWPEGARRLYMDSLDKARSHRTVMRETIPEHPRRSSAGRRRRHHSQLVYKVRLLIPGAAIVLITPVWTDTQGPTDITFMALVRDRSGRALKLPRGASQRLAEMLQGAFTANWSECQIWRADTNTLRAYQPASPSYTASLNANLTETFEAWEARQAARAS